jgi:hypothetical protein
MNDLKGCIVRFNKGQRWYQSIDLPLRMCQQGRLYFSFRRVPDMRDWDQPACPRVKYEEENE